MRKIRKFLLGLVLLIGVYIVLHLILRSPTDREPETVAHRGAGNYAPENTLVSVREAIELGATLIEIDVQQTSDGALILMHDTTVDRTTDGTGSVGELTLEDIKKLDAGRYFSEDYTGEPVPELRDVLTLVVERDVQLVVEVKSPYLYPQLTDALITDIAETDAQTNVIVMSFDQGWLADFQDRAPDITVGSLWLWGMSAPTDHNTVSVHWSSVVIDPTQVRRQRAAGNAIWVWTVNSPQIKSLMAWLGVDAIVTDTP